MSIRSTEFLNKMRSGSGISKSSKFNVRNENLQEKNTTFKVERLKKRPGMKTKLLVPEELAFPFDPFTLESSDEGFNSMNKFRPLQSVSTVLLSVKEACNNDETLKAGYMKNAGVKEWDTSDLDTITDTDKTIFNPYRVPRIFTIPVCDLKGVPTLSGTIPRFGTKMKLDVKFDELGNPVGERPLLLVLNDFCRSYIYKLKEYEETENGKLQDNDPRKKAQKTLESEHKDRLDSIVVGSERRDNNIIAVALDLSLQCEIPKDVSLSTITPEILKSKLKLVPVNKRLKNSLNRYTTGEYSLVDYCSDFVEIDIKCGNEADPKELGQNADYSQPLKTLDKYENFEYLADSFAEFFDNCEMLEEVFLKNSYVMQLSESYIPNIFKAIREKYDIKNPCIDQEFVKRFYKIIPEIYGEAGEDIVNEVMAEISDLQEGRSFTEEEEKSQKRALSDIAKRNEDRDEDDEDDEEEENLHLDK